MILDRMYETVTTESGEIEYTDTAGNLWEAYGPDFADPYLMGYVKEDDIPDGAYVTKITVDEEAEEIRFEPVKLGNVAWGFWGKPFTDLYSVTTQFYTLFKDGEYYGGNNTWRLFNKTYMHKYNYSQFIYVGVHFYLYNANDIYTNQIQTSITDFTRWTKGEGTLRFSFGQYGEADIPYSTDSDGYIIANVGENTFKGAFISFSGNTRYTYNGYGFRYYNPFYKLKWSDEDEGEFTAYVSPLRYLAGNSSDAPAVRVMRGSKALSLRNVWGDLYVSEDAKTGFCIGKYEGVIKFEDLPTYNQASMSGPFKIVGSGGSYDTAYWDIRMMGDASRMVKMYDLYNKIDLTTGPENEYPQSNTKYDKDNSVSIFDDSDSPLSERVSDEYKNIVKRLRVWQMYDVDITADEFDVDEDMPDDSGGGGYEDGEDNPDDKTFADEGDVPLGDPSIFNAPQSFCKYYALSETGVYDVGKNLWTGLQSVNLDNLNDSFFLNFRAMKLPNPEDYNLDFTLSDVIDYFVKLQWFPFKTTPYGYIDTAIVAGTGTKPIPVSGEGNCKQLMNTSIQVSLGSCNVPEAEDVTDIEPYVSCSIYVPYCGTVEVPYSQVQGRTISCEACIDLVTGDMVSVIVCHSKNPKLEDIKFPVATITGKCGFDLQMSGSNFSTQALGAMVSGIRNQMNLGNMFINAASSMASSGMQKDIAGTLTGAVTAGANVATEIVNQRLSYPSVMGTSPISVGSATGTASLLLPQVPYIQIVHHNTIRPDMYGETYGRPAFKDASISQCTGFVIAQNPKLEITGASAEEIDEIRSLLSSGVYV